METGKLDVAKAAAFHLARPGTSSIRLSFLRFTHRLILMVFCHPFGLASYRFPRTLSGHNSEEAYAIIVSTMVPKWLRTVTFFVSKFLATCTHVIHPSFDLIIVILLLPLGSFLCAFVFYFVSLLLSSFFLRFVSFQCIFAACLIFI
jgi:hypothetical protein